MENKNNLFKIFLIVFALIFAINIGIISASKDAVKQKEDAVLEANRPANISLIIINDHLCIDCANITPIIDAVKKTNLKITKEEAFEFDSPEGKDIIKGLEIKKLPTFILKGELNKNADVAKLLSQIGEIKDSVFKFNYFFAPYMDLASNSVKGKVIVTFINDKTCTECYDANPFKQILANNLGMANPSVVTLDKSDSEAQSLIKKYKIESVPMFVIIGETSEYPNLTGIFLQIGSLEKDGAYVLRDIKKVNPNLIYRDLANGKIVKPEVPQAPAVTPSPTGSPAAK